MTRHGSLTGDARRLIADRLHSVGGLDILLLVRGDPDRWWSAEEIAAALHCPPRWAALQLEELSSGGLLVVGGEAERVYAFRPRSPSLADAVDALARANARHAGDVARLILAGTR
jgi:hypothetical protein